MASGRIGGANPDPCEVPGVICTVAGTGSPGFDGDGKAALESTLFTPLDVCFDLAGRALILDWNNLRLRRINENGSIETPMGQDLEAVPVDGVLAKDTAMPHVGDIEMDAVGNLYMAGGHAPIVLKVGTDGRVRTVAGNGRFGHEGDGGPVLEATLGSPYGVLPTADGGFYVGDSAVHVVRYVDAEGTIETVAGTGEPGYSGNDGPGRAAQLDQPTRLRLAHGGSLFICDTGNHAVRRLDADGAIHAFAGTGEPGYSGDDGPAVAARLNSPYDIRLSPAGDAYIADSGNDCIRRVDANGIITTVVGTSEEGFAGDGDDARTCLLDTPAGIAFDTTGAMWIADSGNHRVRRVAGFLALYGD